MIPKIVLDPRNDEDLLEQAKLRTQAASGGTLADFTPSSPVSALLEGVVFPVAELLFYLNLLPEALALEVARLAGVDRSEGTKATGSLLVQLTNPLGSPFVLPNGYTWTLRGYQYQATEALTIPTGALEGRVAVEAIAVGTAYNQAAYNLSTSQVGLAYVGSVYNDEAITGGSDLEPMEALLVRIQEALRRRDTLITAADFEQFAQEAMGSGSRAWCIPLLNAGRSAEDVTGAVHVMAMDSTGTPASPATCASLRGQMEPRAFAGCSLWVSPVTVEYINIRATIGVPDLSPDIAQDAYAALTASLDPSRYPLGRTVNLRRLERDLGNVDRVDEVSFMSLANQETNYAMTGKWSLPAIGTLELSMVDPDGNSVTFYFGNVEVGDRD
jgi:uncharacterized phage protein gp47/JayE